MESQEDRFIRKFMLIEDDRKERNFDQRSVERKQRVMPQGQIDLGIYPGEDSEEPEEPLSYGFRLPISLVQEDSLVYYEDDGMHVYNVNQNISSKDFTINPEGEYPLYAYVASPNLTLSDCKIFTLFADGSELLGYPCFSATFNNCTFLSTTQILNSTFYRCDFDQAVENVLELVRNETVSVEQARNALSMGLFNESNIYIECKTSSLDDYPELVL